LSVQKALVAGLKEILKSGDDLSSLQGKVQGLQDGWKEIQHPDRRLLNQFQELVQEYGQLLEKNQRRLVESKRERWWLKSGLLHELTVNGRTTKGAISKRAATAANKAWPEESSEDTLETGMDQALKDIIAGNIAGLSEDGIEAIRKQARMLCIRLEFIAGMPSPDEDRDRRMKYQVDRLAESMSGESARQPASVEASETEMAWLKLYELPEADFKAFGQRIKLALAAISESI
jgi:hypothetical protein